MNLVVVGALVRGGRVLLGHRRPDKHAYPDVWDLPGGFVDPPESELNGLVRELREELGVRAVAESASHLCRVTVASGERSVLLSAWVVRSWRGEPSNTAPEEHDDLGWFGAAELPALSHPDVRAALVAAMKDGPGA